MNEKISLIGLTPEEMCEKLSISPLFRAKQIYQWLGKGVSSFDEMKNLDKATRQILEENAVIFSSKVSQTLIDPDGTIKLQITLQDSRAIETVLLTDKEGRKTACVSCQAGCAMKCAFCQTGTLDNIVFIGMV